jgi:hypothetical protein
VIGCTYTPLLTKIHLGKRRTRIEVDQLAAITQSRASCPLAKKLDLAESHSGMSNGRSDTTPVTAGPVLHYPPTSKCPVIQSASTAVRSRHIRGRSLRNFNRRRRRLYQKRKRVAARLRRRSSGRNTLSPAERGQLRQLRKIWNTAHKKKDIMYCSSSQEYLRKSHNLKTFKASRRGAVKLVKHVFIDKWRSRESHRQSKTRICRLPRRYQSVVPYFQLLLSNYKKKGRKLPCILDSYLPLANQDAVDDMYNKLCNPTKVSQFLICTLKILIPQQLWGSLTNRRCFFTHLQRYTVNLRRWERVSVRQLMHGIKTSHCSWLKVGYGARGCGRSDMLKQKEMLACFLCWVMELVVDLVKV